MKRRLLNLVTVVSLMLCVASCVLWVRSYWVADTAWVARDRWQDDSHKRSWQCSVSTVEGVWRSEFDWGSSDFSGDPDLARAERQDEGVHFGWSIWRGPAMSLVAPRWSWSGFGWVHAEGWARYGRHGFFELTVPAWLVVLLTALPAAKRLAGTLRGRRHRTHNRCLACSYDLTGNVSGVCPECGAAR